MKKVAFIIGAGASKAINKEKIPVMDDFFIIADKFAKKDANIRRTLDALKDFGLLKDGAFYDANLEYVLEATTELPRSQDNPWERPYDGLLLTFHKIFWTLNSRYDPGVLTDALRAVKPILNSSVVFISFNYDVYLERALRAVSGWRADTGYGGKPVVGFVDSSQADSAQEETNICDEVYAWEIEKYPPGKAKANLPYCSLNFPIVFKPHGSLNWFIHSSNNNSHFWIPDCTSLLLMGPNKEEPTISRFWVYNTTNSVKGEFKNEKVFAGGILPAILPPGKKFISQVKAQVFENIYNGIVRALTEISTLVIIGWSMSGFDVHYREIFDKIKKDRKKRKLEKLIACDIQKDPNFYERFRVLLPAKEFLICKEGLGSVKFINLLQKI